MTTYNATIGTKWMDRNNRECVVFDIYTTTNTAGIEMRKEYASYHTFLGQRVEHLDNLVTIAKGIHRKLSYATK